MVPDPLISRPTVSTLVVSALLIVPLEGALPVQASSDFVVITRNVASAGSQERGGAAGGHQ